MMMILRLRKKSSVSFMIGAAPLMKNLTRSKPRAVRTFWKTRRSARPKHGGTLLSLHIQRTERIQGIRIEEGRGMNRIGLNGRRGNTITADLKRSYLYTRQRRR